MFWQRVCRRRKRFCRLLGLRVHRRDGRIGRDPAWVPEQRLGDVPCAPFCAYLHSPLYRYGHMRRHGILPRVQADEYSGLGYVCIGFLFIFAALTISDKKGGGEELCMRRSAKKRQEVAMENCKVIENVRNNVRKTFPSKLLR